MSDSLHSKWMKVALDEAIKAYDKEEIPIGSIVVKDGRIIGRGYNQRETMNDPTAHAEILVIKEASQILKTWRLENTTLAITLEPDPMCAGAIVNARIKTLLYSSPNLKSGAAYTLYNIPQDKRLNHFVEIRDNILSHESEVILSSFFESKR